MNKKILVVVATVFVSLFAQAETCPDLQGTFVSGGERLVIKQSSCQSFKMLVSDGFEITDLLSEYFPEQGEYSDPRFDHQYGAIRSDRFEGQVFVSETTFKNQSGNMPNKLMMRVYRDAGKAELVVEHLEYRLGVWSTKYHWTWK